MRSPTEYFPYLKHKVPVFKLQSTSSRLSLLLGDTNTKHTHAKYTTCKTSYLQKISHAKYTTCKPHHMQQIQNAKYTTCKKTTINKKQKATHTNKIQKLKKQMANDTDCTKYR